MSITPEDYSAGRVELLTGGRDSDVTRAAQYRSMMNAAAPLSPVVMRDPEGFVVFGEAFLRFVVAIGENLPAIVLDLTEEESDLVANFAAATDLSGFPPCAVVLTADGLGVVAGNSMPDTPAGPMIVVHLPDPEGVTE